MDSFNIQQIHAGRKSLALAVIRKMRCKVKHIIDHGSHVYTLELIPEKSLPAFHPGQFLHLALDRYDPSGFWPDSRAFSIASSPSERESFQITYSVLGRFTQRMERELIEGGSVWVKLPYGEFVVEGDTDVVLFAGGTGITAFTAFLRTLSPSFTHSVTLAYGARTSSLLIYREMVQNRVLAVPQLRAIYFVEQGDAGPKEIRARLSVAGLLPHIQDPFGATYFLSGPPSMLKTISQELRILGILSESIRIDAWE
jgi:ferredoxin-NADP reductase